MEAVPCGLNPSWIIHSDGYKVDTLALCASDKWSL